MRCPLCEPHGLGMGLELLLCVPSASRCTHTARTAPYGTVVCIRRAVAERRALIEPINRTWIVVVLEYGDGHPWSRVENRTCRVSTVVTVSYPDHRVRRIERARGRAGHSRFCSGLLRPRVAIFLAPLPARREPHAGPRRRRRTRYVVRCAAGRRKVVQSEQIEIRLDRWIVKCNIRR